MKAADTTTKKDTEDKDEKDPDTTYKAFKDLVNMTASELDKWLKTEESQTTGLNSGDGEAIGHKSGKAIVDILHKKKAGLTEEDYHQMHRVISYISRHKAQKPKGDIDDTRWNYSLKNWGYDYS